MYAPFRVHGTILSSTAPHSRRHCIPRASITSTCEDWVDSVIHGRLPSIPGGAMPVSGAMRTTCTPGFEESLVDLIELAKREQTAIMCAEAVPWRCHRSLIADALLARGIAAREITGADRTKLHTLTPWARLTGTHITYPGELK
jgi:hypothetical protein